MFEKLVESVLVEYVSEWVEGLDAEKMKVAVFSGTVEFRDLQLRTASLDKFQLPIKIKIGKIGRLAMKVPWKRLTKEAIKIQIENVFLLVVPAHQEERHRAKSSAGSADDDEDSYALRLRWAKQQEVRMRELYEKNKGDNADGVAGGEGAGAVSSPSGDTTSAWGRRDRILHNILDNVSFEFSNIHVRYEDTTQLMSKSPLALGLTIDSIVVTTTNANGHTIFVDRSQSHTPFVHKNLNLTKTALYCENTLDVRKLEASRQMAQRVGAYIVHPFNASMKLTINHDETTAFSIPKLQCLVDITTIKASVTPNQCNDVVTIINFVTIHEMYLKRIHCRRRRPIVPVKSNVKEWWRYAVYGVQVMYSIRAAAKRLSRKEAATASARSPQCDWKFFGTLVLSRKEYINLHKKLLRAAVRKVAAEKVVAERCRANELEDKLDVNTIVFLRLCAAQEIEAEESRVESGKKLSSWKSRFNSRTHGSDPDLEGGRRRLDISEKLQIYIAVNEQIHASSIALAQSQQDKKSSEAILFAIDLAISSVQLLLVEPCVGLNHGSGSSQIFMMFELDKIMFAIFQRVSACTISSSIGSASMLDFSEVNSGAETSGRPRALFSLIKEEPPCDSKTKDTTPAASRLLELNIDSSEQKFKLECKLQRFRYIHHLAVATKLQAYFSSQVEVAPVIKENAEEAFAYSSVWLNKAVFDSYNDGDHAKGDRPERGSRAVECHVELPEVDLLVLSSEISPVLHAQLFETVFKSADVQEAFAFSVESIEILFLDGIAKAKEPTTHEAESVEQNTSSPAKLQHQHAQKSISADGEQEMVIQPQHFEFSCRKRSTILGKTRLVIDGRKVVERNRISKWSLQCTVPPIYFTLSSAQYHQVVQASASWAKSNQLIGANGGDSTDQTVKNEGELGPVGGSRHADPPVFDPDDERVCFRVLIPQIMIIFEGDEQSRHAAEDGTRQGQLPADAHDFLGMDLVLDIKEVNVEARISSHAQAIGVGMKTLVLFKHEKTRRLVDRDHQPTKTSMPSMDAIEQMNKEYSEIYPEKSSMCDPDPAYDLKTKKPSQKLLEIGPTASLLISSLEPFKCKVDIEQVALYWDQELLITLFRSYVFDEPLLRSALSSRTASRASSRTSSANESKDESTDAAAVPSTEAAAPATAAYSTFQVGIRVQRLFLFLRPIAMKSSCFSIRLTGREVCGTISSAGSAYVSVAIALKQGVALDSIRFLRSADEDNATDSRADDEEICALLHTSSPVHCLIESAGYGALEHRAGAGVFVKIDGSAMDMNFVTPYYTILLDYIQRDILGFFSWFEIMTRPESIAHPNERTKLDITVKNINMAIPRSGFGTALQKQKPEHIKLVIKEALVASRSYPDDLRLEQLGVQISGIEMFTSTSASASVPASRKAQQALVLQHNMVVVEIVTKPIPVGGKKSKGVSNEETTAKTRRRPRLDMHDIIREMENMCTNVRVSLRMATSWIGGETNHTRQKMQLQLRDRPLTLNLDPLQLKLVMCLADENFSRQELEIDLAHLAACLASDEKLVSDIDIDLGTVELNLKLPDALSSTSKDKASAPSNSVIGRICLHDVKVMVNQYSTHRTQCRVQSSSATCWKVDWIATRNGVGGTTRSEEVLTPCAELYESTSAENLMRCIDVTVDIHPPPANTTCSPAPQDIRIHVDTCAISPPIVQLGMRLKPFIEKEPTVPLYTPSPASEITLSISTGVAHVLFAEYVIEGRHSQGDVQLQEASLKLIASGCFVVRLSTSVDGTMHTQAYGRKMSLEVASKWPPAFQVETLAPPPSSPSPRRTTQKSFGDQPTADVLSDYRRVLCDDFALDMDVFDTGAVDQTVTVSASLTHFHAVLCVFDMIMLMDLSSLEWTDELYEKLVAEFTGTATKSDTSVTAAAAPTASSGERSTTVVNIMLEDASVTFVREIGEYFSPVARIYSFCAMCKVSVEAFGRSLPGSTAQEPRAKSPSQPTRVVDVVLHFSEDSAAEMRDDDGVSMWGFNTTLGAWEPIMEPWLFSLALKVSCEDSGRTVTKLCVNGSENHALNVNFSPAMLESFCAIVREFQDALVAGRAVRPSTARIISCGFYLANDCGLEISYWVSNNSDTTSHVSRGYTYANRQAQLPDVLLPRQKVPLKLSTAIFPSLPTDQVVSFSWGDEWCSLTDVRIHNAGKYIYSVLPNKSPADIATAPISSDAQSSNEKSPPAHALLALFDISAVFGYRTLTVSSLVRVFNDTSIAVDCAILDRDGKSIVSIGTIEANEACGVPMDAITSLWSVRVFVKPHLTASALEPAGGNKTASGSRKNYRWSNEIFISDKEDSTEHFASCSLVLEDYECRCQRMFDGSQPLHVSQICHSNGSCFRAWSHVFTSSNSSALKYAQIRVVAPLTFENKCGVPVYAVAFVFKKVRRAGGSEREYFHMVASEKIPPHGSFEFLASSLHESTYCSISLTGFSWSNLFLLPNTFEQPKRGSASSSKVASSRENVMGVPGLPVDANPAAKGGCEIMCSLQDFRSRAATISVAFQTAYHDQNDIRKVVIQPRFVIHNATPLPLTFTPHAKVQSKMPTNAKTLFSLPGSPKKTTKVCCASPQLEMLHSKLNELNGATTTPSTPPSSRTPRTPGSKSRPKESEVDEKELFYCSEFPTIDIQLDGNAHLSSGVQQFRLDSEMGGTNTSLRLFDEAAKRWCDLVAILNPIDACTTKVTFVERYLVLNRTEFELMCAPACDLRLSVPSTRGAIETAPVVSSAGNNQHMVFPPRSTTAFSWSMRTVVPSDACVRLKFHGGSSGAQADSISGWRWSGKLSLHEVSETALKLSNRYSNEVHVLKVEVRIESAIRVFVVITSEDAAPFPLYRVINSSTKETIHIKQSFDGGTGDLSESSAVVSAEYNRGVMQSILPNESKCFGWDEAYFLQSLERMLIISYVGADAVRTKILLDQPGEAKRVDLPASKTRSTDGYVFVHWYLHGITKTIHIHDHPLPRDKQTGKLQMPLTDSTAAVSELDVRIRMPNVALSILTSAPEELLLLSAEKAEVVYAVSDGEHDQFEFKLGSLQLDNQLDEALFPVVFTPLPTSASLQLPFMDNAVNGGGNKDKTKGKAKPKEGNPAVDGGSHDHGHPPTTIATPGSSDEAPFVHLSLLRLRYGDDVEYIKYLSVMVQPAKLQVDDVLILEAATLVADCFQVVQRYFAVATTGAASGSSGPAATGAPANLVVPASGGGHRRAISAGAEAFARRRAWSEATPFVSPRGSPGVNDSDQWRAVSAVDDEDPVPISSDDEQRLPPAERRMYIELLELHPLKLQLTFQPNDRSAAAPAALGSTYFDARATLLLPLVFAVLQSRLANVDAASLALNALHVAHAFTTRAFLLGAVRQHYTVQGARQLYALVGAAELLGNPLGLVTNLGTGVRDFFYEPMAGLVVSPNEFVRGLSRGTASLVRNSVYGTFNAASKLTGTLSSGVAALSMDRTYLRERDARNRRDVATHLGTGLLLGTKQLGQGVVAGVTGVVTAPALGAYHGGLSGFVEGFGKGLLGVAVKPAAGVLDLAAKTAAGITATATVFDRKARSSRMRPPRLLRRTRDTRLRVFAQDEAKLATLLRRLPNLLSSELYDAHIFLPAGRALLATSLQLLFVETHTQVAQLASASPPSAATLVNVLRIGEPPARVLWAIPLGNVWGAQRAAKGVTVLIGSSSTVDLNGGTPSPSPVVPDETVVFTKSSMSAVLVPLADGDQATGRVLQFVDDLVARQRERTPRSD